MAQEFRLTPLLELAIRQHPSVLQSRGLARSAYFELEGARWGRFPSLSTEVRSDSSYSQSVLRLEQPLWAGGRIDGRIDVARTNLRAAEAAVEDAETNALTQVATAFFESVRLSARLRSADANVAEHERLRDLIARRMQAQISPMADVTLAQARLQQALTERLQITRQLDAARSSLAQWAGPIDGEPIPPAQIRFDFPVSVQESIDRVLQASAQRRKLQAQIDSAAAQASVARAQVYPTLVAGVQRLISGANPLGLNREHAYLSLQYQPGSGLSALSGTQAALARKEAAERELQTLERALEAQVRSLLGDIRGLESQLQPSLDLLGGTSELVESYLRQYQIGRKTWLDVLNALREKTQADYNLADVRFTLMLSQLKLLLLQGEFDGKGRSPIPE